MASNNFKFSIDVDIPAGAMAELQKAAQAAFKEVAAELDGRFTDAMSGAYWDWPRQSKRGVSGSTLAEKSKAWHQASFNTNSPRSIVDSGDLKQSKDFKISGLQAEWAWTAEYAAAVHDGARIHPWQNKKVTVELPARPWTTAVLKGGNASIEVYDFATELSKRIPDFLK